MRSTPSLGLGLILAVTACGQLAEEPSGPGTSSSADAPGSGSASPPAASGTGDSSSEDSAGGSTRPTPQDDGKERQPTPAICSGASTSARAYATPGDLALALQGLWVTCDGSTLDALCVAADQVVLIGTIGAPADTSSRSLTCGRLSSHGDAFIADPAATYTYEVNASSSPGRFVLHVWNAGVDRMLDVVYYAAPQDTYEEALALSTASASAAVHRTAFTTY